VWMLLLEMFFNRGITGLRSEAQWRDLRFSGLYLEMFFNKAYPETISAAPLKSVRPIPPPLCAFPQLPNAHATTKPQPESLRESCSPAPVSAAAPWSAFPAFPVTAH
jgi:hypothetical protein